MKTRYILYPLLMLLAILLPTSCSLEEDILVTPITDGDKISFTMGVSVTGASNVESRALGAENHDFTDLYVAVFEETDGVSYLKDFVKATDSETNDDSEHGCKYYNVELTKSDTPCRVHIIANYPDLNMGTNEEGQLIGLLATKDNDLDVYWNYVNLEKIDLSNVSKLRHVPLVRNYVTIELDASQIASKTNFILDGYALYNTPTKGTVAAYNPSSLTNKFANFVNDEGSCQTYLDMLNVEEYEGNEAYDDGTLFNTTIEWKVPSTISYMYERRNRTAENKTCMLIKGRYVKEGTPTEDTQPTYYKLDFVYQDQNSNSTVYYNLLRNFVYKMQITDITGSGYSSETDALDAPASNNISGDVVTEDFTNISYANKQLYVSSTYVLFTNESEVNVYFKYISNVDNQTKNNLSNLDNSTVTDKPVTITASTGNGSVLKSITVANSDETSGQYVGWRRMTLKPNPIPEGSSISQDITIAAGGLQRKVELLLRNTLGDLTVTTTEIVVNKEKAPLDVTFTLPTDVDIPEALFPLRFFIYSDGDTIFPEYGSGLPSESQNKKFGFVKVLTWEEYQESRTVTCKFITNCAASATTVRVSNLYLTEGSDSFVNADGIVLSSSVPVTITRINGRYPQNIYNNGTNDGIEREVTVKKNGTVIGTISINRSNVTSSLGLFPGNDNADVIFEFTDKYWSGGDTWASITYRATGSLSNISNGLTFNPVGDYTPIPSLTIPQNKKVSVQTNNHYGSNYYPERIQNGGTESVEVRLLNGEVVGYITINGNIVTEGTLYNTVSFANTDTLVFTFSDKYCTGIGFSGMNWNPTWSNEEVTYTATCTVSQLKNANNTLSFNRQQ